ncbi:glycogen debranching protein [Marivirga salinae]|uniref:Glycogen debranching protein n=1 Tax=Marivirga salinarum TaxID=3059078 RepID=A0AA51NC03_9BACT|nr:glycogen debranching protein [Marivirga sp. BDSF4-3]WMN12343.1 glycogen debranching protein [Marivirga sp. BDSF4-3]
MKYIFPLLLIFLISCQNDNPLNFYTQVNNLEKIEGKEEYMKSPFLSAGKRLYVVGHQNGSFPDLGWHVKGEMGGVWLHPIKLLDGYQVEIRNNKTQECLTKANQFFNYPIGSEQVFNLKSLGLNVSQFHFVPENENGLIIAYQIENTLTKETQFEFTFNAYIDLRPVWLADSLNIEDGQDEGEWKKRWSAYLAKDKKNNWFTAFGGKSFEPSDSENSCKVTRKGLGFDQALSNSINLKSGEKKTIYFIVSGSDESEKSAIKTYNFLSKNVEQLLEDKIINYRRIQQSNKLITQDEGFNQMYRWLKYNSEWLMQDVPGIGTGLTAGSPDYPWWFGTDNGYALQGLLASGMHKQALQTIELIVDLSRKANGENGRIMHEASTNGVIFNPGNLNTTPKFVSMLWKAFAWTGDKELLGYYGLVKKSVEWLESQDMDGNTYPDGAGMMEIHGLDSEMIDVVSYQYEMYLAAANFAKVQNENVLADEYRVKAENLKMKINTDWWVPEFNSFADFRSDKLQAIRLTENAIIRADSIEKPWSVEELRNTLETIQNQEITGASPFVVHHNWIVNTPMEVGAADQEKAEKALKTAENYRNRFGMFVTGIDRDEQQEKASKWKSFSYVGAVMTLPTGVQAIAEAKYGNADKALEYLKMLQHSFSYALPGSMYEVSPDFGMMTQAWNSYAVAVPVVEEFFGIQPKAWKNEIVIKPNLPTTWTNVSLDNIKIEDNKLDISAKRIDNVMEFRISQMHNWKMVFEFQGAKHIIYDGNRIKGSKVELYDRLHNLKVEF